MGCYVEEVECLFLSAIRKGLCLRASDLEIVRDWESRGVPLDVVSRGIVGGIRRFLAESEPTAPLPSALRYYRTSVEKEFETWSRATARGLGTTDRLPARQASPAASAAAEPTSLADRAADVLRSRIATSDDAAKGTFVRALERFEAARSQTPLADLLFEIEDMLVTEIGQSLSPGVFADVRARVDESVRIAAERGVGRRALEDLRRNGLRKAVAEHVGFESFIEEVLKERKH